MSDPYAPRRVCVTIKVPESKRYASDNPWLVFEGTVASVKADMAEAFGMSGTEELSLHSVTINAQNIATQMGHIASTLGASVVSEAPAEPQASGQPAWEGEPASADVWAQAAANGGGAAPAGEKSDKDPILTALELATTIADVQQVWAENQDAFNSNEEYMNAYKARGKALMGK